MARDILKAAGFKHYNTFEKSNGTLDGFGGENVDIFCVRALPTYWIIDTAGNFVSYPVDNIFTDIIEYYMYDISHTEPNQSNNLVKYILVAEGDYPTSVEEFNEDKAAGIIYYNENYYQIVDFDANYSGKWYISESYNPNVTIKLLEEDNRSKMSEILINDKGHIYSPKVDRITGALNYNSFILPQAIVSENAPENVPIGTLWYDTKST